MKIFYFTGTGNSLYVAKRIGGELYSIPLMLREGQQAFEAETIGFVFPCYAFGLPRMVTDFIKKSDFRAEYFFAIMTCGNKAGGGLRRIEEVGEAAGLRFDYINKMVMVDNYLPLFKVEDQLKKEPSKKIDEQLAQIINDINSRHKKLPPLRLVINAFSKVITNICAKFLYDNADKRFIITDACNSCQVCAQVCPKNNISIQGEPKFLHQCEGCFACIHNCPQNAIYLNREKSRARFRNQHVELKEIIASNNQADL